MFPKGSQSRTIGINAQYQVPNLVFCLNFNSAQAQLVILCPTILNIFSLSIKLYSCTHILSVLPIAQLEERQTVVLKVVISNPAWQM